MDVAGTSGQNWMRQFGRVVRTALSEETQTRGTHRTQRVHTDCPMW